MRSVTLSLILVYIVYNIIYFSVFLHENSYGLAWAPNVFLVGWLLLLYESKKTRPQKLFWVAIAFSLALPASTLLLKYAHTGKITGLDGYMIKDALFVGLSYFALVIIKSRHPYLPMNMKTHGRYLLSYFVLLLTGMGIVIISSVPTWIFSGLTRSQIQLVAMGNLMAFFLYGVPIWFLWINRFDFHLKMYQGQAVLTMLMMLGVFFVPDMSPSTLNWILWGGMYLTLLWRSMWCQVIVFGIWGPLITQEFALRSQSLTEYSAVLFVIIATQILWLLFLHGDFLYGCLQKIIEKQSRDLNTDPLTSSLNRRGFYSVCQQLMREEPCGFVGIIDINHFKAINDSLGHEAGDQVLQIVANRLAGCMGGRGRVARPGGDEFTFVVPGNEAFIEDKCQLLFAQLNDRPIMVSGQLLYIGVSVGLSRFPRDGRGPEQMLRCADIAMYKAKRQRLQESIMYEPSMTPLKDAIGDTYFLSYVSATVIPECYAVFHPVYNVREGRLHSVEALIRHPDIPTAKLVSWAEQSGKLDEILEQMLILTLPVIRELSLPVSLNVSPTQLLSPDKLIRHLAPALAPGRLSLQISLEITENVAITDTEGFRQALEQLKSHGFKISLDDFGAGFAFFETLNMGYFDVIKLDRGLITDIHRQPKKQFLVQSIMHYAGALGIIVIAEGVEIREEVDFLLSAGVIYMQGFYFSEPLSQEALCELYIKDKFHLPS